MLLTSSIYVNINNILRGDTELRKFGRSNSIQIPTNVEQKIEKAVKRIRCEHYYCEQMNKSKHIKGSAFRTEIIIALNLIS